MSTKNYFMLTFGCQMNFYDSNLMEHLLEEDGFTPTDSPENAHLIIVNTCAVRAHAVSRALSRIDQLSSFKRKNRNVRIGVTGCIPQQLKDELLSTRPFIDFILGPDNLHRIASCARGASGTFVAFDPLSPYAGMAPACGRYPEAFVAAMRGCNNFCSYCIVPYVRGKERSRTLEQIMEEIELLSRRGYKRIVLLGQNVNNYRDNTHRLPHLLSAVASVNAILRIGFLTSHPAYFPLEAIEQIRQEPKIERFLHLPLQSGSSKILSLMQRGYTAKGYAHLIQAIRDIVPDIALSTDIIVGFPGETDDDFLQTLDMVQRMEFDFAYMFRYSARKSTLAHAFGKEIPEEVKKKRLRDLIRIQNGITTRKSNSYKGRVVDVLALGRNRKNLLETDTISVYNKRIIVQGTLEPGTTALIRVNEVRGWTPIGVPLYAVPPGAH
jgi:tRNA-2-methylthio-N6-dimethylallyladenosine synthase